MFTQAERSICVTYRPTTQPIAILRRPLIVFLGPPRSDPTVHPVWPAAQLGHRRRCPRHSQAPLAPFPMPTAPVAPPISLPAAPPQKHRLRPGGWCPAMPTTPRTHATVSKSVTLRAHGHPIAELHGSLWSWRRGTPKQAKTPTSSLVGTR